MSPEERRVAPGLFPLRHLSGQPGMLRINPPAAAPSSPSLSRRFREPGPQTDAKPVILRAKSREDSSLPPQFDARHHEIDRTRESLMPDTAANVAAITAAQACLDAFMAAFNARDLVAFERTFNFPSIRLACNTLTIIEAGYHKPEMFDRGALKDWHHSAWERRAVIHAGADKVHLDTRFTRYRADGSIIGSFDSIYVVTCENGHWGIKARSSFAP
jgi:hypothetical protein